MLESFLSHDDAARATRAFAKLAPHDIRSWALSGGLAIEIHHAMLGYESRLRSLNDVDFITASFDFLPASLGRDYLFRHVHPYDPPGKTILQAIDPDEGLRIDVFRADVAIIERAPQAQLPGMTIRLVSLEDLAARTARLVLDLAGGVPVPAKHAEDFLGLIKLVDSPAVEAVWQEHRKPGHPATFRETSELLQALIPTHQSLLITPDYSVDVNDVCRRCQPTSAFQLADPNVVLSLLGYC